MTRFQWKVLPQGMANSPTLCQKFVAQALAMIRKQFPEVYVIHYMDDILLAHRDEHHLLCAYGQMQIDLEKWGLIIAPEKVQKEYPYSYLGYTLYPKAILPQKIQIRKDQWNTLSNFQKLLGDINWLRPHLKITTGELKPLFNILKGDSSPTSPRELTSDARQALQIVESAIEKQQVQYLDYTKG